VRTECYEELQISSHSQQQKVGRKARGGLDVEFTSKHPEQNQTNEFCFSSRDGNFAGNFVFLENNF